MCRCVERLIWDRAGVSVVSGTITFTIPQRHISAQVIDDWIRIHQVQKRRKFVLNVRF